MNEGTYVRDKHVDLLILIRELQKKAREANHLADQYGGMILSQLTSDIVGRLEKLEEYVEDELTP